MPYHERCDTINKNPALVVRHFHIEGKCFLKQLYLMALLGKQIIM